MIICKKCKKVVSYNSYFQKYICNNCGWECKEDAETNIKENIKIVNTIIENSNNIMSDLRECEVQAIENILADRERLIKEIEILKNKNLQYDKTLEKLQKDTIWKSEVTQLQAKANAYDSLAEKIAQVIIKDSDKLKHSVNENLNKIYKARIELSKELLEAEKEKI